MGEWWIIKHKTRAGCQGKPRVCRGVVLRSGHPLMKKFALVSASVFCALLTVFAVPLDVVSQDDASQGEYGSGWSFGKSGGDGFGKWNQQTKTDGGDHSHAGFYVATTSDKADLNGIATAGKAFGLYSNGSGFEEAAAFRAFDRPLQVGQSFSLLMEHGKFVRKSDAETQDGGSCGFTLLPDVSSVSSTGDYNKNSRFEFGYYQTESAYIIYDGDGQTKLDVPFTDAGLAVTLTLVTPDTYNLEVTVLATRHTYHFDKRKLGGTAGDTLGGFCLFDRNGELYDVFFNGFQVLQKPSGL